MACKWSVAGAIAAILSVSPVRAAVTLPDIFAEHMVLQQGVPIVIWGTVNGPGDQAIVHFAGRTYTVGAGRNGDFRLRIPPMKAGGPFELSVSDLTGDTVQLYDVLVGDVWLIVRGAASEAEGSAPGGRSASCPFLRVRAGADTGPWALALPRCALACSAAAYFFGSRLFEALKVPIGVVETTPSEIGSLAPYAIRGAVWLPGDRGTPDAEIRQWRKAWGGNDLPALCVQTPGRHVSLRDLPAVTIVEIEDPGNQEDTGRRLAAAAARALEK